VPRVSVITPTFNRSETVGRAVKSVAAQTFDGYEHIVVDDGSTDDTEQVLTEYDDDRLTYIRLETNQGPAAALNRGIDVATGDYISFLDSDDVYHPNRLAVTVDALERQTDDIGGVYHLAEQITGGGLIGCVPASVVTLEDLADENCIVSNTNTMYRTSVFDHVGGFDEKLRSAVDCDLQLRVAAQYDLIGIDRPLSKKDTVVDGIQDDPAAIRHGEQRLIDKHQGVLTERRLSELYYRIGYASLELGEKAAAQRAFQQCLSFCPPTQLAAKRYRIGRVCLEHSSRDLARHYLLQNFKQNSRDYRVGTLIAVSWLPVSGSTSIAILSEIHTMLTERLNLLPWKR